MAGKTHLVKPAAKKLATAVVEEPVKATKAKKTEEEKAQSLERKMEEEA